MTVQIGVACKQKFQIGVTKPLVDLLTKLGHVHYDGACKAAVMYGGFVYGWSNYWALGEALETAIIEQSVTNRELQTCLKICEYAPQDLSDKEHLLKAQFQAIGFAALRQADNDERFRTVVPVYIRGVNTLPARGSGEGPSGAG